MLRKATLSVLTYILWSSTIYAQNLVPNGSFEDGQCPTSHSQMDKAEGWYQAAGGSGTCDYFHECSPKGEFNGVEFYDAGVPRNHIGYQYARTGMGYAGIYSSGEYNEFLGAEYEYREYIGVELKESLEKGSCYYFEMYVSLADSSKYAISTIGAAFTKNKVEGLTYTAYFIKPQIINNTGILKDSFSWVKVSGNFIAEGGEKHLMIGNFSQNNLRQETSFVYNSGGAQQAYYYIDDVLLEKYIYNEQLVDTLLCPNTFVSYDVTIDGATGYKWNFGAETSVVNIADAGYYYVDIKLGGCTFRDEANVDIFRRYDEADRVYCSDRGESRYIDISARGDAFLWNDSITTGARYFDSAGQYSVLISDQCGNYRDDIHVSFYDNCNAVVITPNAFTPNNDGLNDGFRPVLTNVIEYEFIIFNRWGEIIFKSENTDDYWDGTYNGKLCPQGTYLWVVFYGKHLKSTKPDTSKKGTVTLLR